MPAQPKTPAQQHAAETDPSKVLAAAIKAARKRYTDDHAAIVLKREQAIAAAYAAFGKASGNA